MKTRLPVLAIFALLLLAKPAFAHRLDEYLQAATIEITQDQLSLRLRLTPGVAVFDKLISQIDTNGDGVISNAEQDAYAQQVGRDLSLSVDGKPVPLRITASGFPKVEEIKAGLGEIELNFAASVPAGAPNRTVIFKNHHEAAIAAYLVNCLVPTDPAIRIVSQDRSYDQSSYQLNYTQAVAPAASAPAASAPAIPAPGIQAWVDQTGGRSLFTAFFYHGVRHILTGYDHLLFVSALVLAATTLWDLVKVVSTFTIAHTLTLTLAAMNLVHLPERVVEPLISASIVFVALQNVFWPRQARGWGRLGAAFFFGLFHGLGFAGGLLDTMREMQSGTMFLAIVAFSLGVEAGHQMIVLPLFAFLKSVRQMRADVVSRAKLAMAFQRLGSAGISVAGAYYLLIALRLIG